jgi:hypothetical protein
MYHLLNCQRELLIRPHAPWATPPGNQVLIFSHASFKTVGTVIVFSSFLPLFVECRPYFVGFISSHFYGAGPCATARHWRMLAIVSLNHG